MISAFKNARVDGVDYTVTLSDGRIWLNRIRSGYKTGDDYAALDFPGSAFDFARFTDERPQDWFKVANAILIEKDKEAK